MNINFSLIIILIAFNYQTVSSRGGRGGGSRGGGFRSSSRSGFRSGTSGKIGFSSRYSSWSSRHGFSSSFRYRSSSYYTKRTGISMGLILVSSRHRNTYIYHSSNQYDDISICYNESPLYDRNISRSPWFVCPWDNPRYSYCCGDEIEERCCTYFERPGHLAGLILGFMAFIILIVIACHCYCKLPKSGKSSIALVNLDVDKTNNENPDHVQYTTAMTPNLENVCPTYTQTIDSSEKCPLYAEQHYTDPATTDYSMVTLPVDTFPTSSSNANDVATLPYPTNPVMLPHPQCAAQSNCLSYDESGPQYPLIPPENPPPSYSDVIKESRY